MDINNQNFLKHLQSKEAGRENFKLQNNYSHKNDSEIWNSNFYKGADDLDRHRKNQFSDSYNKNSRIL